MRKSILLDETLFDETHTPVVIQRDHLIKEITNCLRFSKLGRPSKNLFIYGNPGTGKTSTIRWILKKHFPNKSVYVNCWSKMTSHKILEDILLQSGIIAHGRESVSDFVDRLEISKKRSVICLDEVDRIKDADFLYSLVRNSYGLVLVSNQPFSELQIDNRIKSRLFLQEFEFEDYKPSEVFEILKDRAKNGIHSDAYNEELLWDIAKSSGGDARLGLQILRDSARDCELRSEDIIKIREDSTKHARKYNLPYLIDKLNDHQKIIYGLMKRNKIMSSGDLFREFCFLVHEKVTDRTYRNYMARMENLGLVRTISAGRWKKYEIV